MGRDGRLSGWLWLRRFDLRHCRAVRTAFVEIHIHQRWFHYGLLHDHWFDPWRMALEANMSSLDQAFQTQLNNIQKKTGKTMAELDAIAQKSGLTKHGELREMFKTKLGLGHGDANSLVHAILQSDGQRAAEGKSSDAVLDEI